MKTYKIASKCADGNFYVRGEISEFQIDEKVNLELYDNRVVEAVVMTRTGGGAVVRPLI